MESSKDAYRIEELRLEVAKKQTEANSLLLQAKTKELEIERMRSKEKDEITKVYKYLLDCKFGKSLYNLLYLKNKSNAEVILRELDLFLKNSDSYDHRDYERLRKGWEISIKYHSQVIAKDFINRYNKFLSLGHPGYKLSKESVTVEYLSSGEWLSTLKESQFELEQILEKNLQAAIGKLSELEKEEKEKEQKIADAKKLLKENNEL